MHLRVIRNQIYKPPSNPSKCSLEAWNIHGSWTLLSPGGTPPSAWLEHEGPSGHPRLSGTKCFLSLGRGTETSSTELFILKGPFKSIRDFDVFNGWSHFELSGR